MLIPLRVIAESIGKKVEWDADNRLIYIGSVQFYDKANAAKYAACRLIPNSCQSAALPVR